MATISGAAPGFQDRADIRLGAAVFNTFDAYGVAWAVTDIDGWWELPPSEVPDDPRPYSQDGSYYVPGRFLPRIIVITGTMIPMINQELSAVQARNLLNSAVSLVRTTDLFEVDEGPTKVARVQLSSFNITNSKINGAHDFTIELKASDPRKYAAFSSQASTLVGYPSGGRTYPRVYPMIYGTSGSSGILTVVNEGNYSTGAMIEIDGPIQNPSIEHIESGSTLQFSAVIPNGSSYTVDLGERTILLDGVESRRSTLSNSSSWFVLQPGVNTLRFNGALTDQDTIPSMTVTYQSAWIF